MVGFLVGIYVALIILIYFVAKIDRKLGGKMENIEFASTYNQKEIEQIISKHLNVPVEWVHLGVIKDEVEIDGKKYDRYVPALTIHGYQ